MKPIAKIVSEIGCVHLGSLERAKELCNLSKICGADFVKTQKRNPDESTPEDMKHKPHPNAIFSYGNTYLQHRQNLELDIEDHVELEKYCNNIGIGYTTSVWDMTSAKEVNEKLNIPFIKIPSACNQYYEMLDYLAHEYDGDIHLSTGMTTSAEKQGLFDWIFDTGISSRIVIYHCTSKYPCPFEDLYLLEIQNLVETFRGTDVRVGFSNHGKGIAADVAGYMLGAEWIERHFIDDRTIRHTDAAASLEAGGLSRLVRDLKAVNLSLRERPCEMDSEEAAQRRKLKYGGFA